MAWIELHQTLPRHPKLRRLATRLGSGRACAAGHLVFLWLWALDYAQDGKLGRLEPMDVAEAACWEGDAEVFVAALKDSGWMDEDGGIHDWSEYAGRLLDIRRRDAERKREVRKTSAGSPVDVRRTSDCRPVDVPVTQHNQTQPNSTVPKEMDTHSVNGKVNGAGDEAQRAVRFKPPTIEEARLQAVKAGLPDAEVDKFMAHFESNGWRVGRNPMRSWKAAMTTWKVNWEERRSGNRMLSLRDTSSSPTQGF